jgi:hypothetical protein
MTRAGARSVALSALVCVGAALSACTTMGTGSGSVSPGGAPVAFAWKSTDGGTSGTMSATLDSQQTFSGPYLEITSQVRSEDFGPMWNGWGPYWNDWAGWGVFPEYGYARQYSGRVMANLQAADGQRMRCRFFLNTPIDGMAGGGQGKCQLTNGRSVDAVFPRA